MISQDGPNQFVAIFNADSLPPQATQIFYNLENTLVCFGEEKLEIDEEKETLRMEGTIVLRTGEIRRWAEFPLQKRPINFQLQNEFLKKDIEELRKKEKRLEEENKELKEEIKREKMKAQEAAEESYRLS